MMSRCQVAGCRRPARWKSRGNRLRYCARYRWALRSPNRDDWERLVEAGA